MDEFIFDSGSSMNSYNNSYGMDYGMGVGMGAHMMGMGSGMPGMQFEMDRTKMQMLGFTFEEMNFIEMVMMNEGKVVTSRLVQIYGLDYEEAQKIKYMYDICTGKIMIQSEDDLSKHFRKMFGKHIRYGIHNLDTSSIGEIPRMAVVGGIPNDNPFAIWNSNRYPINERMYLVDNVSGSNIVIETNRIPKIKFRGEKKIEGILEIKEDPVDGKMKVAINRDYCKLCNRFVIAASLRRPEFHHGMIEIICIEGTKVYVFADTLAAKKYARYGTNTQRVYDYGYFPAEIIPKLMNQANKVYNKLQGVYAIQIPGNADFNILEQETNTEEEEEIMLDEE